ncbi:MAG: antibiotic biosynthesis monooxygenase [Rhodobacteraceae bacterium]|nr:antibiotic biosynthesis monooxygenase [Paracoccaceae bacterium]MCF8520996.1 antibiotic biosynthesis monooxygenase [Paracoccaceae bacterium]
MDDNPQPVTVIVRRTVKPGHEAAYEAWLDRLTAAVAAEFPGYMGAEFHRPANTGDAYRSIFRFDSLAHLEAFEASELRARMLAEAAPLFAADAVWARMTGLEFWFDPSPGTHMPQPSPHRMALVLICVVFVLVMAITLLLGPFMQGWPLALRALSAVTLQVLLMTYVIMPRLSQALARFIFPTVKYT